MTLFNSGIRPAIDQHLLELAAVKRDYGEFWSASSAGYCMRKNMFERLGVPHVIKEDDARKQRVFTSGHMFHDWIQGITEESGLSIAQELELQDEELMVRGHIDDLVLVDVLKDPEQLQAEAPKARQTGATPFKQQLILYDYKTRNSKNFGFSKKLSYYHKLQVGTYMYMLRRWFSPENTFLKERTGLEGKDITEARILNIEKDTLRMTEVQVLWTPELEKEVLDYWTTLNGYWSVKDVPPCTCADHENGFMADERWNPYFYNGKPCSLDLLSQWKKEQQDAQIKA